jgi:hypothetical protein
MFLFIYFSLLHHHPLILHFINLNFNFDFIKNLSLLFHSQNIRQFLQFIFHLFLIIFRFYHLVFKKILLIYLFLPPFLLNFQKSLEKQLNHIYHILKEIEKLYLKIYFNFYFFF